MLPKIPENIKSLVSDEFPNIMVRLRLAVDESKGLSIISDSHVDEGSRYIAIYKQIKKRLEAERKQITEPINKQVKLINDAFKTVHALYEPEFKRLESELKVYLKKKQELAALEQKREQEEMEEQLITEAEIFNDPSVLDVVPQVEIKREKLSHKTNHLTTRKEKKWRLVDINEVPLEYLTLNEKAINNARKDVAYDAKSTIAGIEFYYEEVPVLK